MEESNAADPFAAIKAFLAKAERAALEPPKAAPSGEGASALGAYLLEDLTAQKGTPADYRPRTFSDSPEKAKKTISVQVLGSETPAGHEIWLNLWTSAAKDMPQLVVCRARESDWELLGEIAGKVSLKKGALELAADPATGIISLIFRERRQKPFPPEEFNAHLKELFAEMDKFFQPAHKEEKKTERGSRQTISLAALLQAESSQGYGSPAELLAALESGAIGAEALSKGVPLKIGGCDAKLKLEDASKGKRIELEIAAKAAPAPGALARCRLEMGDPSFSVKPMGEKAFSIRRTTRSAPVLGEFRQVLDYASGFLKRLEQPAPAEPPRPSPEAPPEGVQTHPEPEVLEPAEEAPVAEVLEVIPEEEPPIEPKEAQATHEEPPAQGREIIEEEEVSLDELLSGTAAPKPPPPPPPPPRTAQKTTPPPREATPPPRKDKVRKEPEEPIPDRLFGKVKALERLGRDVLGVLYKGEDTSSGQIVTLKVIDRDHTLDPNFSRRFVRESWPATKLQHPVLKRVLASGHTKDQLYYYVSEYVEGTSARALVESNGPLAPKEAVRIALELAKALSYAHSKGVFHGDIRPSLVLISPDRQVKLSETGVARDIWGAIDRLLARQGWAIADAKKNRDALAALQEIIEGRGVTVWFLAPDLAAPRAVPDARVDVYGLGATMYFLVTGHVPFEDTSPLDILTGEQGDCPGADEMNPAVPKGLAELIGRMMAKGASERPQTMDECVRALEALRLA